MVGDTREQALQEAMEFYFDGNSVLEQATPHPLCVGSGQHRGLNRSFRAGKALRCCQISADRMFLSENHA